MSPGRLDSGADGSLAGEDVGLAALGAETVGLAGLGAEMVGEGTAVDAHLASAATAAATARVSGGTRRRSKKVFMDQRWGQAAVSYLGEQAPRGGSVRAIGRALLRPGCGAGRGGDVEVVALVRRQVVLSCASHRRQKFGGRGTALWGLPGDEERHLSASGRRFRTTPKRPDGGRDARRRLSRRNMPSQIAEKLIRRFRRSRRRSQKLAGSVGWVKARRH